MAKQNTDAKKPNFKHNKAAKTGKKQGGPQQQNKYAQYAKKPTSPAAVAASPQGRSGPCVRHCGMCISCKIAAADQQNASRIARAQSSFRSPSRRSASW
jgi:hypothetical protein